MKKRLQLKIAEPCGERWEGMRPEERGRFCAACSKTVVDFTELSDREVLAYLARAGRGVCGRFSAEQVGRSMELVPAPAGRAMRRWWRWLVAGLLFSAEARGQGQVPKATVVQVEPGKRVAGRGVDTVGKDSIHYKMLPEVVVEGYGRTMGKVMITCVTTINAWEDSASLKELAADTLTMLGLLPKKELTVYPNPVRKGMVAHLGWEGTEGGAYEVGLFSAAGSLVERWAISVGSKEQVDLIEIPASLASGVYFLRIARAGEVRVLSRKLVVL